MKTRFRSFKCKVSHLFLFFHVSHTLTQISVRQIYLLDLTRESTTIMTIFLCLRFIASFPSYSFGLPF